MTTTLPFTCLAPGTWTALSAVPDQDAPAGWLTWQIDVCSDGTFDLSRSSERLTWPSTPTFHTFAGAKSYCERREGELLNAPTGDSADA